MKTTVLLLMLVMFSLVLPASEAVVPIAIGQLRTGTYLGLNPDLAVGWLVLPGSDDLVALPSGTSLFRWDDGLYLWSAQNLDATRLAAMNAGIRRGERAVVALSGWACDQGRFILDSGTWDAERYLFNLDPILEPSRSAGLIPIPEIMELEGSFPNLTRRVRIPLSDIGDDSEVRLIAGVVLVGADEVMGPAAGLWHEIKRVPVSRNRSNEGFIEIALPAGALPRFLAATLVIEDGRRLPLDQKPLLTHIGGWIETRAGVSSPVRSTACLTVTDGSHAEPAALHTIKASGERWEVEINWKVRGDLTDKAFQVYASMDAEYWTLVATVSPRVALRVFDDELTFSWTHLLGERALEPGLYYRVDLIDGDGAVLDTTWTRARLSD